MRGRTYRYLGLSVAAAVILALLFLHHSTPGPDPKPQPSRDVPRSELDLRDGILFPRGKQIPFDGRFFEDYPAGGRKALVEVRHGRLNGHTLGFYPGGKMEVDEVFVDGVSHGRRTRWYENGNRRSVAVIDHGKVTGPYTEWHENGRKAVEMNARDGKPEGVVEAWYSTGAPKSRLRFVNGQQTEKQFWKDPADSVAAAVGKE